MYMSCITETGELHTPADITQEQNHSAYDCEFITL